MLITHGHIDHYGALERGQAPVLSSAGVARQIEQWDAINCARFGMSPPPGNRRIERVLPNGGSLTIDGVIFTMIDAGPGESYDDVYGLITAGLQRAAILGVLAMFGIPPIPSFDQRLALVRGADVDAGRSQALHDLFWRRTGALEADAKTAEVTPGNCGTDGTVRRAPA